jgi:hypothetical protein
MYEEETHPKLMKLLGGSEHDMFYYGRMLGDQCFGTRKGNYPSKSAPWLEPNIEGCV